MVLWEFVCARRVVRPHTHRRDRLACRPRSTPGPCGVPCDSRSQFSMTNPVQPKPNPLPAILVYGTPTNPALTQASWFRAEDVEAVKAAAKELKFSVIELQTDADRALATGAHEGVLKGNGRMIV